MISRINSQTAFKGLQRTVQRTGLDGAARIQELRKTAAATNTVTAQRAATLGEAQMAFLKLRAQVQKPGH